MQPTRWQNESVLHIATIFFFRLIKKLLSKILAKQIKKHYICTRKENFATMKRFYAYSFFYYFYFNRK